MSSTRQCFESQGGDEWRAGRRASSGPLTRFHQNRALLHLLLSVPHTVQRSNIIALLAGETFRDADSYIVQ